MKILSIDTSSPICAVAILEDNKLIKEISQNSGLTHSEKLMPIINQILLDTNLKLKDIDLLVCDIGPGSFTGIRIGVATVKAFTDSLNIPCVGISSLEALSYNVSNANYICSLIDAKNDNAYCGVFDNKHTKIFDFSANHIDVIMDKLKSIPSPITFVGDGAVSYKEKISSILSTADFASDNNLSAFNLGLAGLNYYNTNGATNNILPLYLRAPKAEQLLEAKKNG